MMFKRNLAFLCASLALLSGAWQACAAEQARIVVEDRYVKEVPAFQAAEEANVEGVKAIYYDGPEYKGKPSRVFAYYGIPESKEGKKVPAMVLIHGGGGTAFASWVKLWNSRGYAAIAIDNCGCIPVKNDNGKGWKKVPENGGPSGWGDSFGRLNDPLQDQWPYYAVNAIARARTLIGSFPEVDGSNVGVTGISWGGYLTCLTAGTDQRYRFAAPVYGCGFLFEKSTWMGTLQKPELARWNQQFDPSVYFANVTMPMLWTTGTNDFAYPLESLQHSYEAVKTPVSLCITIRMPHGHGGPGENPPEIKAFADSFCLGGEPLMAITGQGLDANGEAWASFKSPSPAKSAELVFTKDGGHWKERKFESVPAKIDAAAGKVSAAIPEGAKIYYLNIKDERGLVASSRLVFAEAKAEAK